MEEFLRYVLNSIVEFPDEVVIHKTEMPDRISFHVALRSSDAPKVIGKGGSTIRALRTLLNTSASKRNLLATLELIEQ